MIRGLAFVVAILVLTSCGERQFTEGQYDDLSQDRMLDDKFNEGDMRKIADTMVASLVGSPVVAGTTKRPVVMVTLVKNRTEEHIDMKSMTDKIRVALVKSGKFRFTEKETRGEIKEDLDYQNNAEFVDPATAKKKGAQIGADFFLTGEITDRVQEVGSKKYVYYKCTFNLFNIQTNILEWTDEKEIRKFYKKRSVGF